ncbi:ATP-binding protein [Elioraea thermophila]|uniref:ATP-binding protein n=1 Tax=Elioraea thermophila TaxID=2185104 RepID=UPI0018E5A06B|nr:adenylate/guanylate cyclase domain-containing protein [Elioraea thermophila]
MTAPGPPSALTAGTAWLPQDEAERRQVTVAFIDMVGSSRLTALLGAEEMSELIVAYRRAAGAAIEAHGGYIARMLGDGILAYWGFPRAREDDAARALSGCLAVLEAMEAVNAAGLAGGHRVSVRIGLDTGIVVVGRLGVADPRGEADIVGDAPNLAAHLQKAAEPDSIVTTEAVRALAGARFAFEPAGETENPALGRRIPLFRVLGPVAGVGRTRPLRTDRLYGREEEQARLDRAWREACAGRGGAIALIGEAGIGKSALLGHLRRTVVAMGGLWNVAFCQPESAASPLLPVRDLARSLIGPHDASHLEAMAAGGREEGEGLRLLGHLLTAGRTGADAEPIGAAERLRRLAGALRALVRAAAQGRPVALVVEDAHWADDASRAVLSTFAEGLRGLPVLLALSAREEGFAPPPAIGTDGAIRLAPLSGPAMAGLIAALDPEGVLDPAARALIAERAEGNPLFAEELVQLAREAQAGGRAAEILSRASSLNDSLLARLDALGEARPVAQVAAVIGREFDLPLLARVLEVEPGAVAAAVGQLMAAGLVHEAGGEGFAFRHALVRDAAYASMLRARRRTVHARIAGILLAEFGPLVAERPELPAQHLEAAGETDEAIAWWTKAGERAAQASAHADALRLFRHAETLLRRLPGGERFRRRADLLIRIGAQVLAVKGNAADDLEAAYAEAVSILEALGEHESEAMFSALWGLDTYAMVKGDIPRALALGERMRAIARDEDRLLQVHRLLGLANLLRGNHAQAEAEYGAVLARYDAARHERHRFVYGSDPAAVVRAHLGWGRMIAGRFAAAEESAIEAEAQARRLAHPHTLAHVLAVDSLRRLIARDAAGAAARAEEVLRLAARHGFPYWTAWCGVIAAAARPASPAERAHAIEEAIGAYRATGAQQLVPYGLALAAEARLAEGRPHAALALLAEAARLSAATGVALYSEEIARLACLARRAAGLPAEEPLEAIAERAAARGAGLWALRALVDAAAPPARLAALLAAFGLDGTDPGWPDLAAARRALSAA